MRSALISELYRLWRIPATGLAFALFGLGGLALSLTVFPFVYLSPKSEQWKKRKTRMLISRTMNLYILTLRFLGLLTYEFKGKSHIQDHGQLIVANHPTLLDVVFLFAMHPHSNCVVKNSLWQNPFTKGVVSAAQYIPGDDIELVDQIANSITQHDSLIVFPQGTRTAINEKVRFFRAAATAALRADKEILPVYISCNPPTLEKNQPWYQVPKTRPHFKIEVMPPFEISDYQNDKEVESKRAKSLNKALESFFDQQGQYAPE